MGEAFQTQATSFKLQARECHYALTDPSLLLEFSFISYCSEPASLFQWGVYQLHLMFKHALLSGCIGLEDLPSLGWLARHDCPVIKGAADPEWQWCTFAALRQRGERSPLKPGLWAQGCQAHNEKNVDPGLHLGKKNYSTCKSSLQRTLPSSRVGSIKDAFTCGLHPKLLCQSLSTPFTLCIWVFPKARDKPCWKKQFYDRDLVLAETPIPGNSTRVVIKWKFHGEMKWNHGDL